MSTPAVVIGKYLDGVAYGLKCSLPGFNALTDDDGDPSKFSFNSEWTDIVKPHAIGIVPFPSFDTPVYFPALPYRPFYEIRKMVGNVVYDDHAYILDGNRRIGIQTDITTNTLRLIHPPGNSVLYVIYKEQAL